MADIGSTLREARIRERIDITEVEAQTKIRAKYLRAIENEEWDLLPGTIYAKSFLRTYGDYLGLDSRMLVDEFRRQYEGPAEHDIRPVASRSARERERERGRHAPPRRAPAWLPIAAVVVVVLVVLFAVGKLNPKSSSSTSSRGRAQTHHHTVTAPPKTPARTTPVPTSVTLQMVPTGQLYVCLVRGDGVKLINEQTFGPGQAIPSATGARLLLTLGNNSVRMRVNGKLWPVAASPTAIRLMITPTGVRHILDAQTPTCP